MFVELGRTRARKERRARSSLVEPTRSRAQKELRARSSLVEPTREPVHEKNCAQEVRSILIIANSSLRLLFSSMSNTPALTRVVYKYSPTLRKSSRKSYRKWKSKVETFTGSKTDGCRMLQNVDDSSRLVPTCVDSTQWKSIQKQKPVGRYKNVHDSPQLVHEWRMNFKHQDQTGKLRMIEWVRNAYICRLSFCFDKEWVNAQYRSNMSWQSLETQNVSDFILKIWKYNLEMAEKLIN